MSDDVLTTRPSPPPRPIQSGIVPHPAWRQARSALLEAANAGPVTLALLGEAGTGKSWLLRHLDVFLRKQGQKVALIRQGDLPWQLVPGTILLIDEASRLDPRDLAALAAQKTNIVILADLPKFGDALAQQAPPPKTIRLSPIGPDQVAEFVSTWLELSGRPVIAVTQDAVARLAVLSGGTPRLIALLLNAAFAFTADPGMVSRAALDEVAELRLNGLAPPPSAPKFQPRPAPIETAPAPITPRRARPSRQRRAAAAAAMAALAATVLLALRIVPERHSAEAASVPSPSPVSAASITLVTRTVPSLARAEPPPRVARPDPPATIPTPVALAEASAASPLPVALASLPFLAKAPVLLTVPPPPIIHSSAAVTLAAWADSPAVLPPQIPIAAPVISLNLEAASVQPPPAKASHSDEDVSLAGPVPGLVLVARRGDTLRELYASLYRGVAAPPFDEVAAANPRPVVPGAVIVFPAPAGGWRRP